MHPQKTEKKRTFFSTVFRGFSGGFSGDFREIFFGKNPNFAQFYPNFTGVYPAPQSAFCEKPQISRNLSGNFPNSGNPGKIISRNFRKFRPSCFFRKFSGFSGFSGISGKCRISSLLFVVVNLTNVALKIVFYPICVNSNTKFTHGLRHR